LICVGNISKRKNQAQLLSALTQLPKEYLNNITLDIFGLDDKEVCIEKLITECSLSGHVTFHGFTEREELHKYYKNASLNIIASIDEGFGLSAIEGFMYGVPLLTFSDLDILLDINSDDVRLLIPSRETRTFADYIIKALQVKWNREKIIDYSKNFDIYKATMQYVDLYRKVIACLDE
jgi:glycosyltransferase involved in cell wall biosynthesis